MDANAVTEKALEVLADRRVEAEVTHLGADRRLLFLGADREAREGLCRLERRFLREVHDIDRGALSCEQRFDRLVNLRGLPSKVEGHGSLLARHRDGFSAGALREFGLEKLGRPERRRHQQVLHLGQLQDRNLPRPPTLRVGVVVKLVDDDESNVSSGARPKRDIGQDLLRATDDRCFWVDRRIAGDHADVVRAKLAAEREELLRNQCLDRCGVIAALIACHCGEMAGHANE